MEILKYSVQQLRGTTSDWNNEQTPLKVAELGYNTSTGELKIGDGSTLFGNLIPFAKTIATTAELNILHNTTVTAIELNRVHGVTSAIQTQLNSKFAKADIQTSFGETLSDEKVASEKLVKNSLDAKQDGITVANNSMLKASVLSAMNIVGENNSGRRYDEPKTLAKMISAAHSTFDRSKFTSLIHGTPTITADGLMYGNADNSVGSGLEMDTTLIVPNVKNVISLRYTYQKANISGFAQALCLTRFDRTSNNWLLTASEDNKFSIAVNGANVGAFYNNVVENQTYDISIVSDFKTYFKIYIDGVEEYSNTTLSLTLTACSMFRIGSNASWQTTRYNVGAIDLKYLEITNDNIPVFSGNKTGIDTIKPDNYTVVGTPTISTDGIASGFSANDCLTKTLTIQANSNFTIKGKIKIGTVNTLNIPLGVQASDDSLLLSLRVNNASSKMVLISKKQGGNNTTYTSNNSIVAGGVYDYEINVTGSTIVFKFDGATYNVSTFDNIGANLITIGVDRNFTKPFLGEIDLNAFKVYVDGNLVYQPCLKIPYTLAANDKKFISPIYEDRAKDMAEQFGVAPYYILDEDNGNFAMPYGSVEEKIAPKIVVGHYEDGASAWEQYLDRTMIQRGTMVADTDVTFPCSDEYADTNFTLSCPFSAKTTTGFTPSASGTYIAVGKF